MGVALATVVICAVGQPVAARDLTLDDALTIAAERNEVLAIAAEGVEQAQLELRRAWLRLLPTITAAGRLRFNDRRVEITVSGGTRVLQEAGSATGSGHASMTLFDARTVPEVVESQQALVLQEAGAAVERYELLFAVTEAYLSVAIAQNAIRAAKRGVETARETHRITDARVRVGVAPSIDRLRAELAVTRARGAEIAAQSVLADVRAFLRFLLAEEEAPRAIDGVELLDARLRVRPNPNNRRPDLVLLEERLALANTVSDWDWLQFIPSLVLDARFELTTEGGFSNQNERAWVELGLQWDLLQGGQRFVQRSLHRSYQRTAALQLDLARRESEYQADAARQRLQAARAALATAEQRVDLARQARDQVLKSYAAGHASALDLLTSEDELQAAEIGVTADQLNLVHTQLALMRALGIDPSRAPSPPVVGEEPPP